MIEITILCKVIDNFGDIGFVYRLCRSLCDKANVSLRLVILGLKSFAKIEPKINPHLKFQKFHNWKIFSWKDKKLCFEEFSKKPPKIILECFACGRPVWLDRVLENVHTIVQIINIEYLSAESWTKEFHLLRSGTRFLNVKKFNFMPGFSCKTGGLILDKSFVFSLKNPEKAKKSLFKMGIPIQNSEFKVILFTYGGDFDFLVRTLEKFPKKVRLYLAQGQQSESFWCSYKKFSAKFCVTHLPFLPQEKWDALLTLIDFAFIRGEDSFSRAALVGQPFVWQAYKQKGEFHLVKLAAFLDEFGAPPDFCRFSILFNLDFDVEFCYEALEILKKYKILIKDKNSAQKEMESLFKKILFDDALKQKFTNFSQKLFLNGNLTKKLLEVLPKIED